MSKKTKMMRLMKELIKNRVATMNELSCMTLEELEALNEQAKIQRNALEARVSDEKG